jgi:hypothetical protein
VAAFVFLYFMKTVCSFVLVAIGSRFLSRKRLALRLKYQRRAIDGGATGLFLNAKA